MLIVMKTNATDREVATVIRVATDIGLRPHALPGAIRTAIGLTGNQISMGFTAKLAAGPGYAGLTRHYAFESTGEPVCAAIGLQLTRNAL